MGDDQPVSLPCLERGNGVASFGYSLQGVQWEGGAVDGGSIIQSNSLSYNVNHYTLFPLHPPLMNLDHSSTQQSSE